MSFVQENIMQVASVQMAEADSLLSAGCCVCWVIWVVSWKGSQLLSVVRQS